MKQSMVVMAALLGAMSLTGCGGGGAHSDTEVRTTTVSQGQALIDLQEAYQRGAITKDEYLREKKRILDE